MPVDRQQGMSDGIDAAVDAVEAPMSHPMTDAALSQPESAQLIERHHRVLARRELRNLAV